MEDGTAVTAEMDEGVPTELEDGEGKILLLPDVVVIRAFFTVDILSG